MKRVVISGAMLVTMLGPFALACGSSDSVEGEVPAMLRHRFETEMKTILRDVKVAEEQALVLEGTYLALDSLKARYLNRVVPETFALTIDQLTADGFRAQVVHRASGLACHLEVGGNGAGVPKCD